jgi:hypothetical protein
MRLRGKLNRLRVFFMDEVEGRKFGSKGAKSSRAFLTETASAVSLTLFFRVENKQLCRNALFNLTIAAGQKRMVFARGWRPRTGGWS